jgi:hypothetical protein
MTVVTSLTSLRRALRHARLARREADAGMRMRAIDHLHWAFRYFTLAGIQPRPEWMRPAAFTARVLTVSFLLDVCRSSVTSRLWSALLQKRMPTSKSLEGYLISEK